MSKRRKQCATDDITINDYEVNVPEVTTDFLTDCGGCNMKFSHPLYYRMHCSVFHDPNYSLTIRKYHCKVGARAGSDPRHAHRSATFCHPDQAACV